MNISSWKQVSFIDYPEKIATIIFTPGCNYHCPSCHAKYIVNGNGRISEKLILEYLDSNKNFIEGVVICGGEPTLQHSLKHFLKEIKNRNLAIKLDTNGKEFVSLGNLLKENLVDYVAMDVKGPFKLYSTLTGEEFIDERDHLLKGIATIQNFPDYEYRTTIVPVIENGKIRWLSPDEIEQTAKMIVDYTAGNNEHKYFLQKFVARNSDEMLDERLSKHKLPKEMQSTPKELLEEMCEKAKKYLPNTKIRD